MLDYKTSGVDVEKADMLTELIKTTVNSENIGMFAGIYENEIFPGHYLAACTDGVGTKIIPLIEYDLIETAAVDLVAMNVNDLICLGAKPLFFLDYLAVNSLDVDVAQKFIISLKNVLSEYNCILLGGETAELNGLICKDHFDVGGFAVGIVAKENLLRKENVREGDLVVALKSSGPHSNGYTLVRHLYAKKLLSEHELLECLKPTNIYVNEVLKLADKKLIKAAAHITGGGIEGNLSRVVPDGLCAEVKKESINQSAVFEKIESIIGEEEAYKTFNMGVGMCLITSADNLRAVLETCIHYEPFVFGRIVKDEKNCRVRFGKRI